MSRLADQLDNYTRSCDFRMAEPEQADAVCTRHLIHCADWPSAEMTDPLLFWFYALQFCKDLIRYPARTTSEGGGLAAAVRTDDHSTTQPIVKAACSMHITIPLPGALAVDRFSKP